MQDEVAYATVAPGVTLEYAVTGAGPSVVLLHGLGGNLELDREAATKIAAKGYRVLWFSCRGAGRSTLPPGATFTYGDFASDLVELLAHTGTTGAVLVGGSHGANTVLRFAGEYPGVAAAQLVVAPGRNALDKPSGLVWVGYCLYHAVLSRQSDEVFIKAITGVDAAQRPNDPIVLAARTHDLPRARRMSRHVPAQAAVGRGALARVASPTRVLAWRDDVIHPFDVANEVASLIPGAAFEEIDRLAAAPPDVRDAALADAVDRFVKEASAS